MTIFPVLVSLILESDNNIFTIKLDGNEKTYITSDGNSDDSKVLASWSLDGSKIVYTTVKSTDPSANGGVLLPTGHIWTMNADGSNQKELTSGPIYGSLPSYSPDGKSILFDGFATGNPELWLMSADGTDPHPITHTTSSEVARDGTLITWSTHGTFSPDGTKIAYSSTQSGHAEIWVMNTDGSNPTQLTFPDDADVPDANNPTWSPNGSKITFFGGFARSRGYVFTINPDGSDRTQLTFVKSDDPSWSPDSRQIIYDVTGSNDQPEAWIMAADGSNQRLLYPSPAGPSRMPAIEKMGAVTIPDNPYTLVIYEMYNEVLERIPRTGELMSCITKLSDGTPPAELRDMLTRSPEAATTPASLTAEPNTPTLFDFTDINVANETIAGYNPRLDAIGMDSGLENLTAIKSGLFSTAAGTLITLAERSLNTLDGVTPESLIPANFP